MSILKVFTNILLLVLGMRSDLVAVEANHTSAEVFFGDHLAIGEEGKIEISPAIKHVKIDIGLSWCAPISQAWLSKEADLVVFAFEPNPHAVEMIKEGRMIPSHWARDYVAPTDPIRMKSELPALLGSRFHILPCALGLSDTPFVDFYVTSNDCGCSSIFLPVKFPISEVMSVPIFKFSDFFDLFPFDTHPLIDYVKIDAQGADLDIVKSAGRYLQERVVCLTLEPEDAEYFGTQNSVGEADQYMSSIGFERYYSRNTADPTYLNVQYKEYFFENNELYIFQN